MRNIILAVTLVTVSIGCRSQPIPPPVSSPGPAFDGAWWRAATPDDRNGFASGYLDCYIWSVPFSQYSNQVVSVQVNEISSFYQADPDHSKISVPEVLEKIGTKHSKRPAGEPHGAYDGDYWRQSPARLAFIQGYLYCERLYLKNRFSKTPQAYRDAISKWYGVSDRDESALDDRTANVKIGDVLDKLRDGAPPPSQ